MNHISALPVVVPFLAGPLLVASGSIAPRWFEDSIASFSAIAVAALCALLMVHTAQAPEAFWVGGLTPQHGVAIGISLSVDPLGAGAATFAAVLVLAALTYSLYYFDAIKGLYHGLMLMFMAGMVGFCLTGDLFNLVVFFELMSAAAYALTAYRIEERAPIQGAINFAITNSIAGYAMFVAVGMLYARTGALLGALMCFVQRHIKRLLAFSTISHVGMFVCGIGLLSAHALAGVAVYVVGHGFTKGALFMCTGVLLHRFATIDEFDLHGRGREVPLAGVLMVAGGLLLAAAPPFTLYFGKSLLESSASDGGYGWLVPVFIAVSAITGGAVLRVAGRVFLGWGPSEGPDPAQARAAEERVDEERGPREHTPALMLVVPAVLLIAAAALGLIPGLVLAIERQAERFADHSAYATWVLAGHHVSWPPATAHHVVGLDVVYGLIGVLGAVAIAALGLFGRPLREALPGRVHAPGRGALLTLRHLHSGQIGDYIAWWTAGTAVLGGVCLVALR